MKAIVEYYCKSIITGKAVHFLFDNEDSKILYERKGILTLERIYKTSRHGYVLETKFIGMKSRFKSIPIYEVAAILYKRCAVEEYRKILSDASYN